MEKEKLQVVIIGKKLTKYELVEAIMDTWNRMSVATIDSPEFVNITSMENPLISRCEVKVLYVGENRNRSYITKEVAREMAKTLPGCPIVGYYIDSKEDFGDHGDQMIIDGEGVKFKKLTKPYGFVAPDSKIWFQKFEDTDEFGNVEVREYLMTEGYLWTGQFEEAKRVIDCGNPQSMELDKKTLKGHWSKDSNKGIDFFIINDAIFSKLCILGEDVEPCFEGANVSAPKISSSFSKDDEFAKSLYTMMTELKFALKNNEGGLSMENLETPVVETATEEVVENFSVNAGTTVETDTVEINNTVEEFAKKEDEKETSDKENEDANAQSDSEEESEDDKKKKDVAKNALKKDEEEDKEAKEDAAPAEDEEDKKKKKVTESACNKDEEDKKKKFELLETEFAALKERCEALEAENASLIAFKKEIEDKQKDELINSFYMLSDEDKKEVIDNKSNYSLDDIEAKLSVICVRKKVNFDLNEDVAEQKESVVTTFNLNSIEDSTSVPAYVSALRDARNSHN